MIGAPGQRLEGSALTGIASPTIAHLKTHGLKGLFVTCANAAHLASAN
jgi:hypothetical protein